MARTKKVNTNGITSVSQGQLVAMVKSSRAVETKNSIQYKPLFLFCISGKILAKIGREPKRQRIFF
jgi:hypothetical protein